MNTFNCGRCCANAAPGSDPQKLTSSSPSSPSPSLRLSRSSCSGDGTPSPSAARTLAVTKRSTPPSRRRRARFYSSPSRRWEPRRRAWRWPAGMSGWLRSASLVPPPGKSPPSPSSKHAVRPCSAPSSGWPVTSPSSRSSNSSCSSNTRSPTPSSSSPGGHSPSPPWASSGLPRSRPARAFEKSPSAHWGCPHEFGPHRCTGRA